MLDPPASHVDGPSVVQVKHDSSVLFGLPTKLPPLPAGNTALDEEEKRGHSPFPRTVRRCA
jgi:hypothetical protein